MIKRNDTHACENSYSEKVARKASARWTKLGVSLIVTLQRCGEESWESMRATTTPRSSWRFSDAFSSYRVFSRRNFYVANQSQAFIGSDDVITRSLGHLVTRVSLTGLGTHTHQTTRSRVMTALAVYINSSRSSELTWIRGY